MDQGREERGEMDPAFMPRFRGQRGAVAPVRAGVQSGEFSAASGAAACGAALDDDHATRKADQDRGEGGAPRPEGGLSNGGGRSSPGVVPGHPPGN